LPGILNLLGVLPDLGDLLEGCILGGAIGDAWGSSYENEVVVDDSKTYYWGGKPRKVRRWSITDDTQLTLATCEALCQATYSPQVLADCFVRYYQNHQISGIGASTLKAITELAAGQDWSLAGSRSDRAAGNGAAVRIAPLAFFKSLTRADVVAACSLTHRNEEAYAGALAVYLTIQRVIATNKLETGDMLSFLIDSLPDTRLRDRLLIISQLPATASIAEVAALGTTGYVVNSVPLAIFAATKVSHLTPTEVYREVIGAGGDTDSNASIAGQIVGAYLGQQGLPSELVRKLGTLPEYHWLETIMKQTKAALLQS